MQKNATKETTTKKKTTKNNKKTAEGTEPATLRLAAGVGEKF
jgi:hypothetical protein